MSDFIEPVSANGNKIKDPNSKEVLEDRRKEFLDAEEIYIKSWRKHRGDKEKDKDLKNLTGLALSGGGIRSATFCLGVMQALTQKGLFHKFDYLSTVSGGGYIGSSITWLKSKIAGDDFNDADVFPYGPKQEDRKRERSKKKNRPAC